MSDSTAETCRMAAGAFAHQKLPVVGESGSPPPRRCTLFSTLYKIMALRYQTLALPKRRLFSAVLNTSRQFDFISLFRKRSAGLWATAYRYRNGKYPSVQRVPKACAANTTVLNSGSNACTSNVDRFPQTLPSGRCAGPWDNPASFSPPPLLRM